MSNEIDMAGWSRGLFCVGSIIDLGGFLGCLPHAQLLSCFCQCPFDAVGHLPMHCTVLLNCGILLNITLDIVSRATSILQGAIE